MITIMAEIHDALSALMRGFIYGSNSQVDRPDSSFRYMEIRFTRPRNNHNPMSTDGGRERGLAGEILA